MTKNRDEDDSVRTQAENVLKFLFRDSIYILGLFDTVYFP